MHAIVDGDRQPVSNVALVRTRGGRQRTLAAGVVVLLMALGVAALGVIALARFAGRAQAPAGAAWSATGSPRILIHALTRAPWGTLYAGTSRGVYTSADQGATWRRLSRGYPAAGFEVWSVAAVSAPGDDAILAATGSGNVYRLARNGPQWSGTGGPIGSFGVYALYALPQPGALSAGSDYGVFRSTNGGRSWAPVAPLGKESAAVTSFARDPHSGAIYAGLTGQPRPLRVSFDAGRTWRLPAATLPPPSVEALLATPRGVYAGVMGATGGRAVWVGGPGGFRSVAAGLPSAAHGMALATTGSRVLVGTMGVGVYSRAGRNAWTRLGQGPADGLVTSLLVLSGAHPVVLAGTDNGIYRLQLP